MKLLDKKGQALVELALSVFLLLLIVFGIIEFGRVMYMRNTLNNAAREGARMAAVTPSPVVASNIRDYVRTCIPFDTAKTSVVSIETTPTASPSGCTISVGVTYTFNTVVPVFIPKLQSFLLTGKASMRYEYGTCPSL